MITYEKPCPHFQKTSPENPACAWCIYFLINLDRKGRFCKRCREDDSFHEQLTRQLAVRRGLRCGETTWCNIFSTATDDKQCTQCQQDPAFRSFLYGQARQRKEEDRQHRLTVTCFYLGNDHGEAERLCCGGKIRREKLYQCRLKEKIISRADCVECEDWKEIINKAKERKMQDD